MNEEITLGTGPIKKEKFSFTKDLDGVKKTVRGEQVENGWVICIEKEWKEKNPATNEEQYKFNEWKYISKENPLDKLKNKDATTGEEADIVNSMSDIISSVGSIVVD